jgi:hypothetical protein
MMTDEQIRRSLNAILQTLDKRIDKKKGLAIVEECCFMADIQKQKDIDTNEIFYECQNCGTQTTVYFEDTPEGNIQAIKAWNESL